MYLTKALLVHVYHNYRSIFFFMNSININNCYFKILYSKIIFKNCQFHWTYDLATYFYKAFWQQAYAVFEKKDTNLWTFSNQEQSNNKLNFDSLEKKNLTLFLPKYLYSIYQSHQSQQLTITHLSFLNTHLYKCSSRHDYFPCSICCIFQNCLVASKHTTSHC